MSALERLLMEWIEQSIREAMSRHENRVRPRAEVVRQPAPGFISTVDGGRPGQSQLTARPRGVVSTALVESEYRMVMGDGRRKRRSGNQHRGRGPFTHGAPDPVHPT